MVVAAGSHEERIRLKQEKELDNKFTYLFQELILKLNAKCYLYQEWVHIWGLSHSLPGGTVYLRPSPGNLRGARVLSS